MSTPIEELLATWWARELMLEGPGWHGGIGGSTPVQGAGLVDGLPWYFRARWNKWVFAVANSTEGDPVAVGLGHEPGWRLVQKYGEDDYSAGFMTDEEAGRFVEQAIAAYRAEVSSGQRGAQA